jgi:hypothetical protein
MRIAKGFVLGAITAACLSGCIGTITPAANNVPINPVEIEKSTRVGESCSQFIFGMGPIGNSSMTIREVLDHRKITKVDLIEYEIHNYLIFQKLCLVVYGR